MRSIYNCLLTLVTVLAFGCAGAASVERPVTPQIASATEAATPPEAASEPVVMTTETVVAPTTDVEPTERDRAVQWMVDFMSKGAPPGRKTFYVDAQESKEEALERYRGIANAIIDVVYDPETPPLFRGPNGRARTVTVILAVMLFESGFGRHVDFGIGKYGRGDGGKSWCLLQINIGQGRTPSWNTKTKRFPQTGDDPKDIALGYTGPELVGDRRLCVGEALKAMRASFSSCKGMNLPLDQKLRVYGSGSCDKAEKPSRVRMRAAIKFWDDTHRQRGFTDDKLLALIEQERKLPHQDPAVPQLDPELPDQVPATPPPQPPQPEQVRQPLAHR